MNIEKVSKALNLTVYASSSISPSTTHIKAISKHKGNIRSNTSKDMSTVNNYNQPSRTVKKSKGLAWRIEHDIETDRKFNPSQTKQIA